MKNIINILVLFYLILSFYSIGGIGKLYAFGNNCINGKFIDNEEKGILGKLDAYLKINITENELLEVKKIISEYEKSFNEILEDLNIYRNMLRTANLKLIEAKTQKEKDNGIFNITALSGFILALESKGKDLINELIIKIEKYIKIEKLNIIKNYEFKKLGLKYQSTSEEELKQKIKVKLEKKLSGFSTNEKGKLYNKLLLKLDKMIENDKNLETKYNLILLKEVVNNLKETTIGKDNENLLTIINNKLPLISCATWDKKNDSLHIENMVKINNYYIFQTMSSCLVIIDGTKNQYAVFHYMDKFEKSSYVKKVKDPEGYSNGINLEVMDGKIRMNIWDIYDPKNYSFVGMGPLEMALPIFEKNSEWKKIGKKVESKVFDIDFKKY